MKFPIYDTETNEPMGEVEIPDDVIEAARKVENWMRSQSYGESIVLHGVKLASD